MPSSTSSSDPVSASRNYRTPILAAIAAVVLILAGCEVCIRIGFTRISRIESRISTDHTAALNVRHGTNSRSTILLVGNSLLLEALDYKRIRSTLSTVAIPTRFVIEQTSWLDWYYGVRRLLADGSQPDRIVLCLNLDQILSQQLRGEYSALFLIDSADIMDAGRASNYDASRICGLFLARYSLFYAGLNNVRNFTLNRIAHPYSEVVSKIRLGSKQTPKHIKMLPEVTRRLELLQQVCKAHHTRCDVLLPPGFEPQGETTELELIEAGKRTETTILIPVPINSWGQEMFSDGFHVTTAAAVIFTDRLAALLSSATTQTGPI